MCTLMMCAQSGQKRGDALIINISATLHYGAVSFFVSVFMGLCCSLSDFQTWYQIHVGAGGDFLFLIIIFVVENFF